MLGSFNDLIKNDQPRPIPQQMLAIFNKDLPDGYSYVLDPESPEYCLLKVAEGKQLHFESFTPHLTQEQEAMLDGEEATPENIMLLMENALETVRMDAVDAQVVVEDKSLPAQYVVRTVDNDKYLPKGAWGMWKHPSEIDIPLVCGSTELKVRCVQQPSGDIHIRKYASKKSPLVLHFDFNTAKFTAHYNFNFDNNLTDDAELCRDAAIVYDGLSKGTAHIKDMEPFAKTESQRTASDAIAPFWQKVVDLQDALGTKIGTDAELDRETYQNIERLHTSICEGEAVGLGYKPATISIKPKGIPPQTDGKTCRLMFPGVRNLKLFNQEINVHVLIGLSGIQLGAPKAKDMDPDSYVYPITYTKDYQCTILYLATGETDDSEENVTNMSDVLFASLPDGRRY